MGSPSYHGGLKFAQVHVQIATGTVDLFDEDEQIQ